MTRRGPVQLWNFYLQPDWSSHVSQENTEMLAPVCDDSIMGGDMNCVGTAAMQTLLQGGQ